MTQQPQSSTPLIPPHIFWPGLIFGLIGTSVVVCVVTVVLATTDPTVAVEPAYYQRALEWDASQAEQAASDALGWACEASVAGLADVLGRRELIIALRGPDGPIDDADVRVEAFALVRASERAILEMEPVGEGRYRGGLLLPRAGMWEFSVEAERGAERFLHRMRLEIIRPERRP
ncbi:MAG: FixH family protein [Phycisphaerales bacterium JB039]